jgi:hypothetical protein
MNFMYEYSFYASLLATYNSYIWKWEQTVKFVKCNITNFDTLHLRTYCLVWWGSSRHTYVHMNIRFFDTWDMIHRGPKHTHTAKRWTHPQKEEKESVLRSGGRPRNQGCQMVYFQTKNRKLGTFWRILQWQMLVYFTDIWSF